VFQKIRVSEDDFSVDEETALLMAQTQGVGAVCSFVGYVRDGAAGGANESKDQTKSPTVDSIILEHYPGMTEKSLARMIRLALERWTLQGVTVIHRVGQLRASERIVLVVVASTHRGEAFGACEFLMDYLKTQAPFWKKEVGPGGESWVEAKSSDKERADRWQ